MKNSIFALFIILLSLSANSQSYYVAGSFQGWDPGSTILYDDGTNGDLTANDGIHSRAVSIAAPGNYEWKVTVGNWSQAWPQSNSWFETTAANQIVLFTFNANLMGDPWIPNQYIVNANDIVAGNLVLVGSFQSELGEPGGDWVNNSTVTVLHDDGLNGDLAANDGIYSYQAIFPAGTWEGKIVKSGSWNGWGTDGRSINALNLFFATTENQHLYFYADMNTGRILLNFDFPVPVELVSFSANVSNNSVALNWVTASELNNSGFEVQRSVISNPNGMRNLDWQSIGFVNGNGTTSESNSYSFIDDNLSIGKYAYRLKQIDLDGSFTYSNEIDVDLGLPLSFSLNQNYPNPFNPSTSIKYQVSSISNVSLKVYDVLGKEVVTLVNQIQPAGNYEVSFNASSLTSGIYFYKLQAASFSQTKKMLLL
ncbi:choice-of-anchor X domain-containing protein, partial [Ignavibacterium sp.]|uniref:choice-of-anchor X domain-containing protein n=1 Tax=Ignavibacterium sp. TaxID=2651167 RepID=UPI00307D74FD